MQDYFVFSECKGACRGLSGMVSGELMLLALITTSVHELEFFKLLFSYSVHMIWAQQSFSFIPKCQKENHFSVDLSFKEQRTILWSTCLLELLCDSELIGYFKINDKFIELLYHQKLLNQKCRSVCIYSIGCIISSLCSSFRLVIAQHYAR